MLSFASIHLSICKWSVVAPNDILGYKEGKRGEYKNMKFIFWIPCMSKFG